MGRVKLIAFIQDNQKCYDVFSKAGLIPTSITRRRQIYLYYSSLTDKSKMKKYKQTAEAMQSNMSDVRKSVKEMERNI